MNNLITQSISFLSAIAVGIILRKLKILKPEDRGVLANIIFYVTLPALLINGFAKAEASLWYLVAFGLGIAVNSFLLLGGFIAAGKKAAREKALFILHCPGYNVGNVVMPYLSVIYPGCIPYLCMFDAGDSIISMGVNQGMVQVLCNEKKESGIKIFLSSLYKSFPFDIYVVLVILTIGGIHLPESIINITGFFGRCNGCLAMIMIGISLEFSITKRNLKDMLAILSLRYGAAIIFACILYYLIPLPIMLKKGVIVTVFAAIPNVSLIFSHRIGLNTAFSSMLIPASTILAIPVMTIVIFILG